MGSHELDEEALDRRAAAELHVELLPGSQVMRDTADTHFLHKSNSGVVLIPHPSDDPSDPLNWSTLWKGLAVTSQALYTLLVTLAALSIPPLLPLLKEDWDLNPTQLSLLTGALVITAGYANFIVIPFSNVFGRRATSLVMSLVFIGACVWQAMAQSYGSLLGARVLAGFAIAPSETLMVQVIADIFFLHERGFWMGIYFTSLFLGMFIGPVISGNIGQLHGWRSYFWLTLALGVFNFFFIVFCFPETKYLRQPPPTQSDDSDQGSADSPGRKDDVIHRETVSETISSVGIGRPVMKQFHVVQRPDSRWKSLVLRDIFLPCRAFCFPIIIWAGLNLAGAADLVLLFNLTEDELLTQPPYNMSPSQVGYTNFAFVVGVVLGLLTAGPFSDWVAKRATARNGGVREAEMRLPALIPYLIITAVGIVVAALAMERRWPLPIILIFGYGVAGLCVTTVPTIAIAYAVDAYKPLSGEIMVVATVLKNTAGFSMSYWVPSLVEREGYFTTLMVWFPFTVGPILLALPLYFYGKSLRRMSRNSSVHNSTI